MLKNARLQFAVGHQRKLLKVFPSLASDDHIFFAFYGFANGGVGLVASNRIVIVRGLYDFQIAVKCKIRTGHETGGKNRVAVQLHVVAKKNVVVFVLFAMFLQEVDDVSPNRVMLCKVARGTQIGAHGEVRLAGQR